MNRLFTDGTVAGLGDSQLLERFVAEQDSAAFEVLVTRHGPMVLSICRSVLRDPNDAEDAFQATFLVLAKKAATIRAHAAVGGWLHLVARRIALEANAVSARRRAHERQAGLMVGETSPCATTARDDLVKALHDEIARLPEKYRMPVVVCDLQGISQVHAAAQLCWSERTSRRRLAQGRERLKGRLSRRGLAAKLVPRRGTARPRGPCRYPRGYVRDDRQGGLGDHQAGRDRRRGFDGGGRLERASGEDPVHESSEDGLTGRTGAVAIGSVGVAADRTGADDDHGPTRSCARAAPRLRRRRGTRLYVDNRLRGRVFGPDGKPVARATPLRLRTSVGQIAITRRQRALR